MKSILVSPLLIQAVLTVTLQYTHKVSLQDTHVNAPTLNISSRLNVIFDSENERFL